LSHTGRGHNGTANCIQRVCGNKMDLLPESYPGMVVQLAFDFPFHGKFCIGTGMELEDWTMAVAKNTCVLYFDGEFDTMRSLFVNCS
jgi:hypothetical protein